MRILVTGGAGFIASHIVDGYLAAGHEVVVVDDLSGGKPENLNPAAHFYQVDVQSPGIEDVFARERPEILNHHAAQMDVRRSVADPIFDAQVNILGLLNLLERGRHHGLRRVILASSGGAIYGEQEAFPAPETHLPLLSVPMALASSRVSGTCTSIRSSTGFPYVAFRYANVYGPRQDPHGEAGVVAIFSEKMLRGRAAGNQRRREADERLRLHRRSGPCECRHFAEPVRWSSQPRNRPRDERQRALPRAARGMRQRLPGGARAGQGRRAEPQRDRRLPGGACLGLEGDNPSKRRLAADGGLLPEKTGAVLRLPTAAPCPAHGYLSHSQLLHHRPYRPRQIYACRPPARVHRGAHRAGEARTRFWTPWISSASAASPSRRARSACDYRADDGNEYQS